MALAIIAGAWLRPDSIIINTPDWYQVTTPSSPHIWHNKVLRSHLTSENAHHKVRETIEGYRGTTGFIWVVSPDSSPSNLGEILNQEGMSLDHSGLGMVAAVEQIHIEDDPKTQVVEVTLSNVKEYVEAAVLGWSNPEAERDMLTDMTRSLQDPNHKTLYFLARYEGKLGFEVVSEIMVYKKQFVV